MRSQMDGSSLLTSVRAPKAGLGRLYRSARSAVGGNALVLTYHRVTRPDHDPQLLCVDPGFFDEQMAVLSNRFMPMRASDLCGLVRHRRRIPPRTVVVTFDDGYYDLLTEVKPILLRHGVPAAAFISTAEIDSCRERWWDELQYLLLGNSGAPDADWNITVPARTHAQHRYLETCEKFRVMDAAGRNRELDALAAEFHVARPSRDANRTLTSDEVRELADGGIVEIGAHTASHQMMSAVSPDGQRAEVVTGKRSLDDILGRRVTLFSYPYGGRDALSPESRSIVREAGFSCAFANWFGLTFPWTDRYAIPRCPTENISAEAFERRLDEWFALKR